MAAVSLTDYTSQQAELARRQKLADLLTSQGQGDIPIQSYNGTQAAIPWTAVLAKALQTGAGAYMSRRANDDEEKLRQSQLDAQSKAASAFYGAGDAPVATTAPVNPAPRNDDYAAMAAMGPPPSGNPQAVAAALASNPTAAPQSPAAPPQAMAAAMGGQPPQAAPMPAAPPQGPDTTYMSGPQPGPAQPVPAAPVAAPAPPQPGTIEFRAAKAQAQMQAALKMQQQFGPTFAAPYLKAAQEQSAKIQDLQDAAASKAAEHTADVQSAMKLVTALPGLDDGTRALLAPVAAAGGMKALEPALTKLMDNKLGPHESYMTPQEMQAHGFGQGSIVMVNSVTGDTKVLVDGTKVAQENARIGLERQSVGIAGAHLNLDRQKFAADQTAKQNAVIDPATIRQMAMQARQGDTSVFQNLGRGVQGAQNIVALRQAIFDPAMGPMTGAQMAQMNANFKGVQAEQRAVGSRVGNAAVGASEVPKMAQIADAAYSKLSRTELVPFNRLKQMVESGTSSPAQAAAYAADQSVVNAFARAISPTGVGTDAARAKGEKMLNTAMGPEAHRAVLNQLITETNAIKSGAQAAMGTGQAPASLIPTAAAHQSYADPAKEARYQAWLKSHGG